MRRFFRWRAILPFGLLVGLLIAAWLLLVDRVVERSVEEIGTHLVGARVDVTSADAKLVQGAVTLNGLVVTNPDAPMTNLVEVDEVVADLRVLALLERKVVVETLAVRGVRFGTPRQTSGAVEHPSPTAQRIRGEVTQWTSNFSVPEFSLEGLGTVTGAVDINPDNLSTIALARGTGAQIDTLRRRWERDLVALNPRPQIDSVRALIERLAGVDLSPLGLARLPGLISAAQTTLNSLAVLESRIAELDSRVRAGISDIQVQLQSFGATREADYAYARSLLRLPSLDAPEISPALFGQAAVDWLRPVLYWMRLVEEHVPPGLDPRRFAGPDRARRPGTTVNHPRANSYPSFLLEYGEFDLQLGGDGVQAGRYAAQVWGLTGEPSVYGSPTRMSAAREGDEGPRNIQVAALLDHTGRPVRDSLNVVLEGLQLPTIPVEPLGASVDLGPGTTRLSLARSGDEIGGRWQWQSSNATWERVGPSGRRTAGPSEVGSQGWAEDFLWRTVSGLRDVEIDVRISGGIANPSLDVSTNVAEEIAASLEREVGRELERAMREVRAQVDRLVRRPLTTVRQKVSALELWAATDVFGRLSEVTRLEEQLQQELQRLGRGGP